jgi:hypothetical protein
MASIPVYVVPCLEAIDRAEASLWRALLITIGSSRPRISAQQVRDAITMSFDIDPTSLAVTPDEPEDFIVFLPDGAMTERVFNGGAPLHQPDFSLFFKRWTHLA